MIGKRLSHFRLVVKIGVGGMGVVYRAEDERLRRPVAIKVLPPELVANEERRRRFLREARAAAAVTHPSIATVYEVGEAEGQVFIAMELVEGKTLRELIGGRPLPIKDALRIATEVAEGLARAHRAHVIHRDLKPDNIAMGADGHVKILDFGLAKLLKQHAEATSADLSNLETISGEITRAGKILGTVAYMSPEQARGEAVDARSDVFSFGITLYEMVTGKVPFHGRTPTDTLSAILRDEPAPAPQLNAAVPEKLGEIISKCLEKDPAERYQDTRDLLVDLRRLKRVADSGLQGVGTPSEPVAAGETAPARTRSGPLRGRIRALVVGATVIVVAGAAVALLLRRTPAVPTPGRATQVTFEPGLELDATISPDGRAVAYAAGPLNQMRVHVRQVIAGRPLVPAADVAGNQRRPVWSPDGSRLLFWSGDRLYEVPALGGPSRPVLTLPAGEIAHRAVWSPDGAALAYVRADTLYLRQLHTGEERLVAEVREAHSLAWSPDGRWIAYVSGNVPYAYGRTELGNVAAAGVWVVHARGGAPVPVTQDLYLNVSPTWLPDGRLLFLSNREGARDVYVQALRTDGRPARAPVRLTTGLHAFSVTASADGRTLAYSTFTRRQNIWRLRIPATGPASPTSAVAMTTGNQVIEDIAVSPDGEWLAFDSDRSGELDVYKRRVSGGEVVRLTDHPADEFVISWSPDGHWLVGHGFHRGNRDVFTVRADGTAFQLLTTHPGHDRAPDWSPDGQQIVFVSERTAGQQDLFLLDRMGADRWGDPRQLTFGGGAATSPGSVPRWSPDGRSIAYVGPASIRVITLVGGEPRVLARGPEPVTPTGVAWSADGGSVVYNGYDRTGRVSFWTMPASGGRPRLLVGFEDPNRQVRPEFIVYRDWLYFTIGEFDGDVWVMDLVAGN